MIRQRGSKEHACPYIKGKWAHNLRAKVLFKGSAYIKRTYSFPHATLSIIYVLQ